MLDLGEPVREVSIVPGSFLRNGLDMMLFVSEVNALGIGCVLVIRSLWLEGIGVVGGR